jgi:hypothetical protein
VLRRRVPRDDEEAWTRVASLFGEYGLALPDEQTLPDELLRQIESELPETFPELARNRDFLPLIQGFGDEELVPVLVHGARVPAAQALPEDLSALSRLNALELSDTRWDYDVARLIDLIESVTASKAVPEAAVP